MGAAAAAAFLSLAGFALYVRTKESACVCRERTNRVFLSRLCVVPQVCDMLAAAGFNVAMPDFSLGKPFPLENFPPEDKCERFVYSTFRSPKHHLANDGAPQCLSESGIQTPSSQFLVNRYPLPARPLARSIVPPSYTDSYARPRVQRGKIATTRTQAAPPREPTCTLRT